MDDDLSPACEAGDHDQCDDIANPTAKKRDRRGCMCVHHVATF